MSVWVDKCLLYKPEEQSSGSYIKLVRCDSHL